MKEIIYKLQEDGIYYPVISFEQETNYAVGKYGLIIGEYIMTHKRHEYITRINEGGWNRYLYRINETCREEVERIADRIKEAEGVTERLKASNPLEWIGRVNEINMRAEHMVLSKILEEL